MSKSDGETMRLTILFTFPHQMWFYFIIEAKHILNSILKYYSEGQIILFTLIFQNHILLKFKTNRLRSCLTGPMFQYNLYFQCMITGPRDRNVLLFPYTPYCCLRHAFIYFSVPKLCRNGVAIILPWFQS